MRTMLVLSEPMEDCVCFLKINKEPEENNYSVTISFTNCLWLALKALHLNCVFRYMLSGFMYVQYVLYWCNVVSADMKTYLK